MLISHQHHPNALSFHASSYFHKKRIKILRPQFLIYMQGNTADLNPFLSIIYEAGFYYFRLKERTMELDVPAVCMYACTLCYSMYEHPASGDVNIY
jgi:hypothetical protein